MFTIIIERENKEQLFFDKIDSLKISYLYILRKKNANTYNLNSLNVNEKNSELTQFGNNTINEEVIIKKFTINPYNSDIFLINTQENKVFILEKEKHSVRIFDQSFSATSFVELVSYYNEQGKETEKLNYHTNLESIINGKELPSVFSNIFKTISSDILEIYNKLQKNIVDLI